MNEARAGVGGDKIGGEGFAGALAEGMLILDGRELLGWERRFGEIRPAAFFGNFWQQAAKQNIIFIADFGGDVLEILL